VGKRLANRGLAAPVGVTRLPAPSWPPGAVAFAIAPVPPSANDWHRVYQGILRLTPLAREYKASLASAVLVAELPLFPESVELAMTIRWYRSRYGGDVDKRGAVLIDALQGIAYVDDSQLADYRIVREDTDPERARMEIVLAPVLKRRSAA
jgi:Holliday junction resolvase RusA-like endonuclease